jgi:hypothetical protein
MIARGMEIRRVIAGSVAGHASFTHDEAVPAVQPPLLGNEIVRLWGLDEPPKVPSGGGPQPSSVSFFPPPGGMRAVVWTAPPAAAGRGHPGSRADRERTDELVPGMASVEIGADGLHATATVDFELVLHGELELVLEGGDSRMLYAGDTAIVNGVRHAWRNHSDAESVLLAVFFGAREA